MTSPRPASAWRDALWWAGPALLFGLVLRGLLCAASPYAYWGSDSASYYAFAYRLFEEGKWLMPEKREYVYPYLLALLTALPGVPLKWLLLFQHGLGLLTLFPLAYIVRQTCAHWRWVVVPVTLLYAGFPIILWYEHELLGEAFFSAMLVWAMAGWVCWHIRHRQGRGRPRDWWYCLAPLALCVMTKPSGQFLWPGLLAGLVLARAWRSFTWKEWLGTAVVLIVSFTVGERSQGARLLYASTFPLTRLEGGAYPELKREIAPLVQEHRAHFDTFLHNDGEVKRLLRNGFKGRPGFEAWQRLYQDKTDRQAYPRALKTLALEALQNEPWPCLRQVAARALFSSNPSDFKTRRFQPGYAADRHEEAGEEAESDSTDTKMMKRAYGLPMTGPGSDLSLIVEQLRPAGAEAAATPLVAYIEAFHRHSDLVATAGLGDARQPSLRHLRPTWLGALVLGGGVLARASVRSRPTLGAWLLIALSYLAGVFLVGSVNPRFFLPVWPVIFLLLALPVDFLLRRVAALARRGADA